MHVVTITRYVIKIKKHLHNRIEIIKNRKAIIEIEWNHKEYESLHPYFAENFRQLKILGSCLVTVIYRVTAIYRAVIYRCDCLTK